VLSSGQNFEQSGFATAVSSRLGKMMRVIRLVRLMRVMKALTSNNKSIIKKQRLNAVYPGSTNPGSSSALSQSNSRKATMLDVEQKTISTSINKVRINIEGGEHKIDMNVVKRRLSSEIIEESESLSRFIKRCKDNRKNRDREVREDGIHVPKRSEAGMLWFERGLRKVICIYLAMQSGMTFISSDYYLLTSNAGKYDCTIFAELVKQQYDTSLLSGFVEHLKSQHIANDVPIALFQLSYNSVTTSYINNKDVIQSLRNSEVQYYRFIGENPRIQVDLVENRQHIRFWESVFQIISLAFACLVLLIAYVSSSKDAKIYMSEPCKTILKVASQVIRHPVDHAVNPYYLQGNNMVVPELEPLEKEYQIIGRFICKYAHFLGFAFGSQQSNLTAEKMVIGREFSLTKNPCSEEFRGLVVLMELRDFPSPESVEDSRAEYMLKKVCETIQKTADRFRGQAKMIDQNKYILVWRTYGQQRNKKEGGGWGRQALEAAAMGVTCVLKITAKLKNLRDEFNETRSLQEIDGLEDGRTGSKGRENPGEFISSLIHWGKMWQGIIGSSKKLDVVEMGSELCALKEIFDGFRQMKLGVMLTEPVYQLSSEGVKKHCRPIEVVEISKGDSGVEIFSMEITTPEGTTSIAEGWSIAQNRELHAKAKERVLESLLRGARQEFFWGDPEIQSMLFHWPEFKIICRRALDFYSMGAWDMARVEIFTALQLRPDDEPLWTLLRFLEAFDFSKPENWRGFRTLPFYEATL